MANEPCVDSEPSAEDLLFLNAVESGDADTVQQALENGANVNIVVEN